MRTADPAREPSYTQSAQRARGTDDARSRFVNLYGEPLVSDRRALVTIMTALAAIGLSVRLPAQQTQLDLHGNLAVGTTTHLKSWGGGIGAQTTFGSSSSPLKFSLSPSFDVLKQEHGGPTQTTLSLDANIQPPGQLTVTPYIGGSASANWSGGDAKQWSGARLGIEMLAGATVKLSSSLKAKAEERFGYVDGQEHTLTTRVGVLVSF